MNEIQNWINFLPVLRPVVKGKGKITQDEGKYWSFVFGRFFNQNLFRHFIRRQRSILDEKLASEKDSDAKKLFREIGGIGDKYIQEYILVNIYFC